MSGGESEKAVTDDRTIETDKTIMSGGQATGAVGGFDMEILGIEEVMANIRLLETGRRRTEQEMFEWNDIRKRLDLLVKCGVGSAPINPVPVHGLNQVDLNQNKEKVNEDDKTSSNQNNVDEKGAIPKRGTRVINKSEESTSEK